MVGLRQRWGPAGREGFLPCFLPRPPGDSPQLRHPIPGQSELGFPPPASYSLHKHSRPRLCTIGTLLVVGMHLTRKSVQTERGGGVFAEGWRQAQETGPPGWVSSLSGMLPWC